MIQSIVYPCSQSKSWRVVVKPILANGSVFVWWSFSRR